MSTSRKYLISNLLEIIEDLDDERLRALGVKAFELRIEQKEDVSVDYGRKSILEQQQISDKLYNIMDTTSKVERFDKESQAAIVLYLHQLSNEPFTDIRFAIRKVSKELSPKDYIQMLFPGVNYDNVLEKYQQLTE